MITGVASVYRLVGPVLTAEVRGVPVPQGSIRSLGKGRPAIHSNAHRLLPWREQVQHALEDAAREAGQRGRSFPMSDPVALLACFTMPKPKSAPKTRRTYPVARPDGDKLLRCILDAGQNASIYRDDSQVVEWHGWKVYPDEHPDALPVPGVLISVYTVESQP